MKMRFDGEPVIGSLHPVALSNSHDLAHHSLLIDSLSYVLNHRVIKNYFKLPVAELREVSAVSPHAFKVSGAAMGD